MGDKIPPCLTPAEILNQQEYTLPHRTRTKHLAKQCRLLDQLSCVAKDCVTRAKTLSYHINSRDMAVISDAELSLLKVAQLERIHFHHQHHHHHRQQQQHLCTLVVTLGHRRRRRVALSVTLNKTKRSRSRWRPRLNR